MQFNSTTADNSQLCSCHGYKLSNIVPNIAVSDNVTQINIGCDDDDIFYRDSGGRVQIIIETKESNIYIDLEDVLRFAKEYCYGIFNRVNKG